MDTWLELGLVLGLVRFTVDTTVSILAILTILAISATTGHPVGKLIFLQYDYTHMSTHMDPYMNANIWEHIYRTHTCKHINGTTYMEPYI